MAAVRRPATSARWPHSPPSAPPSASAPRVLINVFNPACRLGGYFAVLGRFLMEPMTAELESRVFGPGLAGARVALSTLGFTAAMRGGAHVALDAVFDDPTLVPAAGDPASSPLTPPSTEIS